MSEWFTYVFTTPIRDMPWYDELAAIALMLGFVGMALYLLTIVGGFARRH